MGRCVWPGLFHPHWRPFARYDSDRAAVKEVVAVGVVFTILCIRLLAMLARDVCFLMARGASPTELWIRDRLTCSK